MLLEESLPPSENEHHFVSDELARGVLAPGKLELFGGESMGKREAERERLLGYECPERDDQAHKPCGVLLSDEIEHFVKTFKMIDPFDEKNLKPAGCELTVGDQYSIGGEVHSLAEGEKIRIPPFEMAIIKCAETLNLPRFLIARWNIRVKWAYEGLLWVGGPQVDPGWVGQLPCPIYNLSQKEVRISRGEPFALMDFVTTTPLVKGKSREYERPPKRLLFEEYNTELESALFKGVRERISAVEKKAERRMASVEAQVSTFAGVTITVFAILFAVLALFVSPPERSISWWTIASAVFSVFAAILSTYVFFRTKSLTNSVDKSARSNVDP